jgi:hypothetical protein
MPTKKQTVKPRTKQPVRPTLIQDDAVTMYAALARDYETLRTAYDTLLSHYQTVAYECEMYRSAATVKK